MNRCGRSANLDAKSIEVDFNEWDDDAGDEHTIRAAEFTVLFTLVLIYKR